MSSAESIADIEDEPPTLSPKKQAMYRQIIEEVFKRHYTKGTEEFDFHREELVEIAKELFTAGLSKKEKSKNVGDIIYTYRHRKALPQSILDTQPPGRGWLILGAGDARYRFRLSKLIHICPTNGREVIAIPNATPEIIVKYAQSDEQALLAKIRYNRLIDIFLGLTTYSLQSHLRTKISNYGQIEIDELYTGLDTEGRHFIIPVQAKGPKDKLGVIQTIQDVTYCQEKLENRGKSKRKRRTDFSALECCPVSAQLIPDGKDEVIAMFWLRFDGNDVSIKEEKHYKLVAASQAPLFKKSK